MCFKTLRFDLTGMVYLDRATSQEIEGEIANRYLFGADGGLELHLF